MLTRSTVNLGPSYPNELKKKLKSQEPKLGHIPEEEVEEFNPDKEFEHGDIMRVVEEIERDKIEQRKEVISKQREEQREHRTKSLKNSEEEEEVGLLEEEAGDGSWDVVNQ